MPAVSARYLELACSARRDLDAVFAAGSPPDVTALTGHEFRGYNRPRAAAALGIRKFIKAFYLDRAGRPYGCNTPVAQNGLDSEWLARPSEDGPKRYAFFLVEPADPDAADESRRGAVLLDYGRGGNRSYNAAQILRDYLVRVTPRSDDLLLGKAYFVVAGRRLVSSYFLIERYRPLPDAEALAVREARMRLPTTGPGRLRRGARAKLPRRAANHDDDIGTLWRPMAAGHAAWWEGRMGQQSGTLGADVAVTHILVVADPAASRDFWVDVLGAELYREYGGTSVVLKFAGTWLLLVSGGGPTADKPGVTFRPPADSDQVSHAMTVRVADCRAAYAALTARGASFLTPPHDWGGKSAASFEIPTATSWRSASQYLPNRAMSAHGGH